MRSDAPTEEQAAERLAHHLLREAYRDLASMLLSANAQAAGNLFHVIETRTADTLRALVADRSEGAASTRIARTAGREISELFEGAHGRAVTERTGIPAARRVA
ncbi:hypothetical protein ACQVP2_25685 [Methylobacterium aquaticum]|uniref:hypothetical protein n=1 Tax=Methylobacterium aquaticum TaxID=270351 RepID=UPI003D173F11